MCRQASSLHVALGHVLYSYLPLDLDCIDVFYFAYMKYITLLA